MKPSRTFYILLQQGELYLGFAKFIVWKVRYNACWLSFYVPDKIWLCTIWWPTTVTAKPKTSRQKQNSSRQNQKTSRQKQNSSRQNQKPHSKNKIPHGKTKNLTAKPSTSQQKQNSFSFAVGFCFFSQYLVLPWGLWFCREVFGFAVTVVRYSLYTVEGKCGSS